MKKMRTKHSPALKAKVALEAIAERETVAEIAQRHKVHANVVYIYRPRGLDLRLGASISAPELAR